MIVETLIEFHSQRVKGWIVAVEQRLVVVQRRALRNQAEVHQLLRGSNDADAIQMIGNSA